MAYLKPHFDPDVFVSYSHGDPRGVGNTQLKAWTHALIEKLEGQILSLDPEFVDLNVWMDLRIDPTAHLSDELRAKVSASGVLMIIMSKWYLGSTWCRDELDWFGEQIKQRSGDLGRVFVIRAQPTESEKWPDFLRDERGHQMPGFCFHTTDENEVPLGWPDPLQEKGPAFTKELNRLHIALTKRLRELRDRAERKAKAEAVLASPQPSHSGARRIYLHAASEAEPDRAKIQLALQQEGIVPLTAKPVAGNGLAQWRDDSKARIETAKRCEALALLRADSGERFIGDLLEIGVDERRNIADARGAPLACAVLDKTGASLPIDVSDFGIERFDVTDDAWHGKFRAWLDASRAPSANAAQ